MFSTPRQMLLPEPATGGGGPPSSASFFCRISRTFRWLLEWTSLEKFGLPAGRYSGKSRPDLNRTPHALHKVLAPSGPARHCGVFWTRQWLQRRGCCGQPDPGVSAVATGFFFFCLLTVGGLPKISCVGNRAFEVQDEEEEHEFEESVNEDDNRSDQTRPPVRLRLLLAFFWTKFLNEGFTATRFTVSVSGFLSEHVKK